MNKRRLRQIRHLAQGRNHSQQVAGSGLEPQVCLSPEPSCEPKMCSKLVSISHSVLRCWAYLMMYSFPHFSNTFCFFALDHHGCSVIRAIPKPARWVYISSHCLPACVEQTGHKRPLLCKVCPKQPFSLLCLPQSAS